MKLSLIGSLSVILVACSSNLNAKQQQFERSVKIVELSVPATYIESRQVTSIQVYIPKPGQVSLNRSLPVVFFLHGWGSDAGSFNRLGGTEALASLSENQRFIVVSVEGGTSNYANWADGQSLWERHLLDTILPFVAEKFDTDQNKIAMMGQSMGGAAALRIGMSQPGLVSCVAAHSAAVSPVSFNDLPDWQRAGYLEMGDFSARYGKPFRSDIWASQSPLFLAEETDVEKLKLTSYYFDVGRDDQLGFADDNVALSSILSFRNVPHEFVLREGLHNGDFVRENLRYSIEFLAECLSE